MRLFTFIALLVAAVFAQAALLPPEAVCGRWLTEEKDGVIQVYRDANGRLAGRIVSGSGPNEKDNNNPDPALRNRPLIGITLMYGFTPAKDGGWEGGEIYDPDNGKTYKAELHLDEKNPNVLNLRGYIGVPLFGRTSVWTRLGTSTPDACKEPPAR